MGTIYIIRHGRTAWNKEKIFRGREDVPLDEDGRREAACAAEALRDVSLAGIYTSPLSRAYETARVLSKVTGADVLTCSELIDIDYGEWTKLRDEDARRRFESLYSLWETKTHKVTFPKGESLDDVRARAAPALGRIAKAHPNDDVAVTTHRVVIKVLLCFLKGLDNSHFWETKLDTAAISVLCCDPDGAAPTWDGNVEILKENDTDHLRRLGIGMLGDF